MIDVMRLLAKTLLVMMKGDGENSVELRDDCRKLVSKCHRATNQKTVRKISNIRVLLLCTSRQKLRRRRHTAISTTKS
jgi:hypothetical protein